MKFLVDASPSPVVVRSLREAGHDAVHVGEVLRLDMADDVIFDHATLDGRVSVAADTDFGELLARRQVSRPSVVVPHRQTGRRPGEQTAVLLANLAEVEDDLLAGAIVVSEERRVRVRTLPIVWSCRLRAHVVTVLRDATLAQSTPWRSSRLPTPLTATSWVAVVLERADVIDWTAHVSLGTASSRVVVPPGLRER